MKKLWILAIAWLATLTLAGCNYNKCDCNCPQCDTNCEEKVNESAQFCLENWWTYSQVTAPDEEYGECMFPSGIGCRDDILMTSECNFHPNLEDIDTEEERLAGCEENVQWWMTDFVDWAENITTKWWDESEGWASFVRNWVVKYTKDWSNWKMDVECVADFVDWSLSASYSDEVADD